MRKQQVKEAGTHSHWDCLCRDIYFVSMLMVGFSSMARGGLFSMPSKVSCVGDLLSSQWTLSAKMSSLTENFIKTFFFPRHHILRRKSSQDFT
jgi:hypothetical protein